MINCRTSVTPTPIPLLEASSAHHKDWLIVFVVGTVLFFTNLGATRLWDVDEAIFSRTSVEMLERGDWITPYFNGQMFGHKPPVMYWCQMVAYRLFGTTEFAARFFSAVFGVGTMLLTYELGRTLFNRRVGLWGGIALGSCVNFALIARAATPDVYLTFFCTLAMLVLVRGVRRVEERKGGRTEGRKDEESLPFQRPSALPPVRPSASSWQPGLPPSWGGYAVAYAAIGVAVLVKGPIVGGIVPIAVWGMFLLIEQRRHGEHDSESTWPPNGWRRVLSWFSPSYFLKTVWRIRPITATAIILLVAGPWYAWVGIRTDGEFLREFFLVHNFGRATQAMDSHNGPVYYYLLAVCIGTFPWCMLLGPAIGNLMRAIRDDDDARAAYTLLACWIGVWVGILSLAGTKLPSYIIPCYPALGIMFAALVVRWLDAVEPVKCQRWLRAAWGTTAAVGVGIIIAVPIITRIYLSGEWTPALVGLVPITAAGAGLWFSEHGYPAQSLATLAVMGVAFCVGLLGFAVLPIDAHQNSPAFAEFVRRNSTGASHIATHNYLPASLVYYHGNTVERAGTADEIARFFAANPQDAFLITTSKHHAGLSEKLPSGIAVLKRDRRFLRSGDVVILGRPATIGASLQTRQRRTH